MYFDKQILLLQNILSASSDDNLQNIPNFLLSLGDEVKEKYCELIGSTNTLRLFLRQIATPGLVEKLKTIEETLLSSNNEVCDMSIPTSSKDAQSTLGKLELLDIDSCIDSILSYIRNSDNKLDSFFSMCEVADLNRRIYRTHAEDMDHIITVLNTQNRICNNSKANLKFFEDRYNALQFPVRKELTESSVVSEIAPDGGNHSSSSSVSSMTLSTNIKTEFENSIDLYKDSNNYMSCNVIENNYNKESVSVIDASVDIISDYMEKRKQNLIAERNAEEEARIVIEIQ
jgi:hypothetical protein